ncbi:hypothetical protein CspeluHIS016_0502160 [Cutaneotrichosporon spelunceum]|uniref:Uncharacterized protein n=1 Tax=Cutaneotrichosporon spelunceum TaxID=1672016 RepID=A0AAD3TWL5_9TREE|nr:hypothetical protein CspeluHIS016_0502160 [Cutaneotrichosporon spelunceum]
MPGALRSPRASIAMAFLTFAAFALFLTLNLATPIGDFSLITVNMGPQREWRASFGIYGVCYHDILKRVTLPTPTHNRGKVCTEQAMGWKMETKLFEDLETFGISVPSLVAVLTKGFFFVPLTTDLIFITLLF